MERLALLFIHDTHCNKHYTLSERAARLHASVVKGKIYSVDESSPRCFYITYCIHTEEQTYGFSEPAVVTTAYVLVQSSRVVVNHYRCCTCEYFIPYHIHECLAIASAKSAHKSVWVTHAPNEYPNASQNFIERGIVYRG